MSNRLLSLSDIFEKRIFRIPDYQRGYSWQREHLVALWEDLINLHEQRYHYTGLLSVKEIKDKNHQLWHEEKWLIQLGFRPLHVVDGQQRLTTLSILIHEILELMRRNRKNPDDNDEQIVLGFETINDINTKYIMRKQPPLNIVSSYLFGYETDNPSAAFLKHKVFCAPHGGTIVDTFYTRNLQFAKQFFANNLQAFFSQEGIRGIEALYQKLTQKMMFNLHEIDDDYDVFVAFETMNNRGKKLTNLELLKNRLIYLTTLFDPEELSLFEKDKLRSDINDTWKEVYYQLGRNPETPLSDDDFLRTHWVTYFRYSRKRGDEYIHFLLSKFSPRHIFSKQLLIDTEELTEKIWSEDADEEDGIEDSPEEAVNSADRISPQEIFDYVNSLKSMAEHWYYSFFPNDSTELTGAEKEWINRLNRVGIGQFRPLLVAILASAAYSDVSERVEAYSALERFVFLSFRVGNFNASYKSSYYLVKTRDLMKGNIPLSSIIEDMMQVTDQDRPAVIANFSTRINRLFQSGYGFYGWHSLRYFLFEYELMLSTEKNLTKLDWKPFTKKENDKVSIEHILPQKPDKWYWRNQFRMYTDEEIRILSGSLGNLLPLSQSINSSLQNDSFQDKKDPGKPGRRGYVDGSHSEIEVSKSEDWSAANILSRGLKLLTFLENRWQIPLGDDQKISLLNLGFVYEERGNVPPLPMPSFKPEKAEQSTYSAGGQNLAGLQLAFWTNFVAFCKAQGRDDLTGGRPASRVYYSVQVGRKGLHMTFGIMNSRRMRVGVFVYHKSSYDILLAHKNLVDAAYGTGLSWPEEDADRKSWLVQHMISADVFNTEEQREHFQWLIAQFDKLKAALDRAGL